MGYKVKNLIASKPGLAKVTDTELNYQVFTFLNNKETCETLIWVPLLNKELVDQEKTSSLASYTLDGKQVDKIFMSKFAEFTSLHDMSVNTSQGFVINTEDEKAAGSLFVAGSDEGSFLYGYNELMSKVAFQNYNPPEVEDWVTGFDIFGKYMYTVNEGRDDIRVYDFNFKRITEGFPFIRNIPNNYYSVNIKVIEDLVYIVSRPYNDNTTGGIVGVYNLDGTFVRNLINDSKIVHPWAIVKSPENFGAFGCSYLVGSGDAFDGDGTISAYDHKGNFLGKLQDEKGDNIVIENLKSLKFLDDKLYFSAGNIAARDEDTKTAVIGYIRPYRKHRC